MRHLLLVTATTGYQARAFGRAAARLGARLSIASDRCHQLEDPWGDGAMAVSFEDPAAALAAARRTVLVNGPVHGILACGDRAAVLAAHLAEGLGVPFHSAAAAAICHDKHAFRRALAAAGLPAPWFRRVAPDAAFASLPALEYPCVLKPLGLSGSRGVIRADDAEQAAAALRRIRALLATPEIQRRREASSGWVQVEGFVPGVEVALEGWVAAGGALQTFALFDKPDPLDGPFFEESLYVTPSRLGADQQAAIEAAVAAAAAVGLGPGPIHAEARVRGEAVCVLEIAARPIGGLCGRALRFRPAVELEEVLARAALGDGPEGWRREERAAGAMMIPIPGAGVLEAVEGVDAAAAVAGIEAVEITAKPDQPLYPLPEGGTYLGFIFARAERPEAVEAALRHAHAQLRVRMRALLPVLAPASLPGE